MATEAKMPTRTTNPYHLTSFANDAAAKLTPGTVSHQSHALGIANAEPLIVAMDCLIRYAVAYQHRFEDKLATDSVLGDEWLAAAKGLRGLLNGDGALAMALGRTTDSKDNGAVESMFWSALDVAGFTEGDL